MALRIFYALLFAVGYYITYTILYTDLPSQASLIFQALFVGFCFEFLGGVISKYVRKRQKPDDETEK